MTTEPQPRCCPACGKPIVARATGRHYNKRECCDQKCAMVWRKMKAVAARCETKPCACGCGAILQQRPNEKPSKWRKRQYANPGCYNKSAAEAERKSWPAKTCDCCGKPLVEPSRKITLGEWMRRRFCDKACQHRGIAAEAAARAEERKAGREALSNRPEKTCAGCGVTFSRALKRGAKEWKDRQFCSVACGNKHRQYAAGDRPTKVCECCGTIFAKPKNIKVREWENRRFCSLLCGNRTKLSVINAARGSKAEMAEEQKRARRHKMIVEAMQAAARRPERVRGQFQSVEDFLAAGGQVTRCPTVAVAPTIGIDIPAADRLAVSVRYEMQAARIKAANTVRASWW